MRVRWGAAIAVLAIVAVAACGDDGGGSSPPTTDAPEELTAEEWVVEADALCAAADEAEADAGDQPPGDPRTVNLTDRELAAWGDYFSSILPVGQDLVVQFDELGTPDEIATEVESINSLREDTVAHVEEAVAAAEDGDQIGFRNAVVEALEVGEEIDAQFTELGTEVCGQDGGTTEPSGETIPAEQWTSEVLTICEAQNETLAGIPEPSVPQEEVTEAELPEVATFLSAYGDVFTDTIGEVAQVGTPEGAEADAADFSDALGGVATAFYDSAAAANAGDVEAWNGTTDAISAAFGDLSSIGQDLGVAECAQ
jgi:hypothetical protein